MCCASRAPTDVSLSYTNRTSTCKPLFARFCSHSSSRHLRRPRAGSFRGHAPSPFQLCTEGRCPDQVPIRPCLTGNAIVRTSSQVRVEMVNRVLRYEVDETFLNTGGGLGEADYLFPLPAGSAFEDLKLSINGELVSGETMNATEARRIYEDIVRRRRDPALVEWMGAGLLRARDLPDQSRRREARRGSLPEHRAPRR